MDEATARALALSVAELARALMDQDSQREDGSTFGFDLGRRHAVADQLEVLSRTLDIDDLNDLASELRE